PGPENSWLPSGRGPCARPAGSCRWRECAGRFPAARGGSSWSEGRGQKAEGRQRSSLGSKFFRTGHHAPEHPSHLLVALGQSCSYLWRKISAVTRKCDPDLRLGAFSIGVGKFADKHVRVLPFAEPFGDVRGDASR